MKLTRKKGDDSYSPKRNKHNDQSCFRVRRRLQVQKPQIIGYTTTPRGNKGKHIKEVRHFPNNHPPPKKKKKEREKAKANTFKVRYPQTEAKRSELFSARFLDFGRSSAWPGPPASGSAEAARAGGRPGRSMTWTVDRMWGGGGLETNTPSLYLRYNMTCHRMCWGGDQSSISNGPLVLAMWVTFPCPQLFDNAGSCSDVGGLRPILHPFSDTILVAPFLKGHGDSRY